MPPINKELPVPPQTDAATLHYNRTARILHWLTAALAAIVLPLAWIAANLAKEDPSRPLLFAIHKSVGLTIFGIVAIRILWRTFSPPLKAVEPHGVAVLANINHWLLYAIFLYMPVTGFLLSAFNGNSLPYFYLFSIPGFEKNRSIQEIFDTAHLIGQWAVYFLIGLHVLATIWHAAQRDGVLDRMLPRKSQASNKNIN